MLFLRVISFIFLSFLTFQVNAQGAEYWGWGSMCMARNCAPGKEPPPPRQNIIFNSFIGVSPSMFAEQVSAGSQRAEASCMETVREYCGGTGYSTPNLPFPIFTSECYLEGGNIIFVQGVNCPAGRRAVGDPFINGAPVGRFN